MFGDVKSFLLGVALMLALGILANLFTPGIRARLFGISHWQTGRRRQRLVNDYRKIKAFVDEPAKLNATLIAMVLRITAAVAAGWMILILVFWLANGVIGPRFDPGRTLQWLMGPVLDLTPVILIAVGGFVIDPCSRGLEIFRTSMDFDKYKQRVAKELGQDPDEYGSEQPSSLPVQAERSLPRSYLVWCCHVVEVTEVRHPSRANSALGHSLADWSRTAAVPGA
jgi:hypothetical protein